MKEHSHSEVDVVRVSGSIVTGRSKELLHPHLCVPATFEIFDRFARRIRFPDSIAFLIDNVSDSPIIL